MAAQADINHYWINHCRRKFPHTTGCFFWQYNDPWPTLCLSIVDHYTLPKIAYYHMMRVQKSITMNLKDDSWFCKDGNFTASLYLTSDWPADNVDCTCRILTADGKELWENNFSGNCAPGSQLLENIAVTLPDVLPAGIILAEMKIFRNGQPLFEDTQIYGAPDLKKVFRTRQPEIDAKCRTLTDDKNGEKILRVTITNKDFAALYLRLNIPEVPVKNVYWHDNYVTLAPGESRSVTANLTTECPAPEKLELSAWNLSPRCFPITE
jgi:hypothetical protein